MHINIRNLSFIDNNNYKEARWILEFNEAKAKIICEKNIHYAKCYKFRWLSLSFKSEHISKNLKFFSKPTTFDHKSSFVIINNTVQIDFTWFKELKSEDNKEWDDMANLFENLPINEGTCFVIPLRYNNLFHLIKKIRINLNILFI